MVTTANTIKLKQPCLLIQNGKLSQRSSTAEANVSSAVETVDLHNKPATSNRSAANDGLCLAITKDTNIIDTIDTDGDYTLQLNIAAGVNVTIVRMHKAGNANINLRLQLAAGSSATLDSLCLAAATSNDYIELLGEGAKFTVSNMAALGAEHKLQQKIHIRHAASNTTSELNSRALLGGKAQQFICMQTDMVQGVKELEGMQDHKSLLLSATAASRVQPVLEIATDDVTCAHGATVGALDDKALFYLRSRGLNNVVARKLLCRAFLRAVLNNQVATDVVDQELGTAIERVANG